LEQRENAIAESETADLSADFAGVQQGGDNNRLTGTSNFSRA
jgi:hypothetical protein